MKQKSLNCFKPIILFVLVLSIFACSKKETNLNNLNETFFLKHKNTDMPVHIRGNGSEKVFMILLHGGPGGEALGYRANTMITEIEKNNAVVYFDQRGSGSSQGNYSAKDLSLDLMVEDVFALTKAIKTKYGNDSKFFLMGHSWGGTLGTAVMLKYQNEFLGWIEVCGGHNMDTYEVYKTHLLQAANEQIALGNSVDFWQNLINEVQQVGPGYSKINHLTLNSLAHSTSRVLIEDGIINTPQLDEDDQEQKSNIYTGLWNMRKTGKIFDFQEGLNEINFTDRLGEITLPSLVLWGKHDLVIPLTLGYEAFDNLGSADKEILVFEKSGHSPMFSEPELFSTKVLEFINEHK